MFERGVQVAQGFGKTVVVDKRLAQFDRVRQALTGHALLAQQALAAEHHIAVKEGVGQSVVRVVRRTGALVDILGEEIQLQVSAEFGPGPRVADAVQDDFFGRVQCGDHLAILPRKVQTPGFYIQRADRFEQ